MPQPAGPPGLDLEVAALKDRYAGVREAAALPGADARAVREGAFAELDTAVDVLGAMRAGPAPGWSQAGGSGPEALLTERRLLRAVFQDAPVPMFLLGPDATVQRVNTRAADLLGSGPGYAVGKLFTAFVDLPARAAVQSQLAAVARTGKTRRIQCRLLHPDGPAGTELTVGLAQVRGDGNQLVVVARGPGAGPGPRDRRGSGGQRQAARRPGPGRRPGQPGPPHGGDDPPLRPGHVRDQAVPGKRDLQRIGDSAALRPAAGQ